MNTRTLNLIDDHRRLYLQQSEVEPTLVCRTDQSEDDEGSMAIVIGLLALANVVLLVAYRRGWIEQGKDGW